jgi:CBS domain-containing protein
MKVGDIMTQEVISVRPETTVREAAEIMLHERISGLPVIDDKHALVGVVSEGDLLRRVELDTERHRSRWLEFLVSPTTLAGEYVRSHSRTVANVMTAAVQTVTEDASLAEAVEIMERRQIKRLPVMRAGRVVGIVTRANLLHVLASLPPPKTARSDSEIRSQIDRELNAHVWGAQQIHVVVQDGVVDLWGIIFDETGRRAARTAVENVPGVKEVRDHLTWVEPHCGAVLDPGPLAARDIPAADRTRYP